MKKKIFWPFENLTLLRWVLLLPFALWVVHPLSTEAYRHLHRADTLPCVVSPFKSLGNAGMLLGEPISVRVQPGA
ncbi:hypothetical protein EDB85DRAFT_1963044 [Lactarius pseudohatsudake]|nr:hypothetical protein EDB85DRAFT_1963044 [Lactarius pseudohatsudake]